MTALVFWILTLCVCCKKRHLTSSGICCRPAVVDATFSTKMSNKLAEGKMLSGNKKLRHFAALAEECAAHGDLFNTDACATICIQALEHKKEPKVSTAQSPLVIAPSTGTITTPPTESEPGDVPLDSWSILSSVIPRRSLQHLHEFRPPKTRQLRQGTPWTEAIQSSLAWDEPPPGQRFATGNASRMLFGCRLLKARALRLASYELLICTPKSSRSQRKTNTPKKSPSSKGGSPSSKVCSTSPKSPRMQSGANNEDISTVICFFRQEARNQYLRAFKRTGAAVPTGMPHHKRYMQDPTLFSLQPKSFLSLEELLLLLVEIGGFLVEESILSQPTGVSGGSTPASFESYILEAITFLTAASFLSPVLHGVKISSDLSLLYHVVGLTGSSLDCAVEACVKAHAIRRGDLWCVVAVEALYQVILADDEVRMLKLCRIIAEQAEAACTRTQRRTDSILELIQTLHGLSLAVVRCDHAMIVSWPNLQSGGIDSLLSHLKCRMRLLVERLLCLNV
eukprot:Rmarinus@m.12464